MLLRISGSDGNLFKDKSSTDVNGEEQEEEKVDLSRQNSKPTSPKRKVFSNTILLDGLMPQFKSPGKMQTKLGAKRRSSFQVESLTKNLFLLQLQEMAENTSEVGSPGKKKPKKRRGDKRNSEIVMNEKKSMSGGQNTKED